jgi:hypothetical protein
MVEQRLGPPNGFGISPKVTRSKTMATRMRGHMRTEFTAVRIIVLSVAGFPENFLNLYFRLVMPFLNN